MLALISFATSPGRKYYVNYRAVSPLGLACVWAELFTPASPRERKLSRLLSGCAGELWRLRARSVVFQEGFPYGDYFLSRGFTEISAAPLLAASAGEIASLAASGHAAALLSSPRADRLTAATVKSLCGSFRRLILDVPAEAFISIENVCAAFGVAPEPLPRSRAAQVDAAVFMAPPPAHILTPAACRAVFVNGGQRYLIGGREAGRVSFILPEKYRFDLPFPAVQILSAAVESGRLTLGDMNISVP